MKQDYISAIDGGERRMLSAVPTLKRSGETDDTTPSIIEGYAALYNEVADLRWFKEKIAQGAFDDVLTDDVRALFNHDPNYVLARSVEGKGTLKLSVDEKGLKYSFEVDKGISYVADLARSIERGDVNQSSFGFTIAEESWDYTDPNMAVRTITKIGRLYDVSPVTYPAYEGTTVSARSLESAKQAPKNTAALEAEIRERELFLNRSSKINS
jgi:HK97 family phage prohead protease